MADRDTSIRRDPEDNIMKTTLSVRGPIVIIVLAAIAAVPAAFAGIPEPPIIIYGRLQTSGGLPVTSGELRFEFLPVGGGTTVRTLARVGSLSESFQFVAFIPNERTPVTEADQALELGSGKTYTPRAYYNGVQLTPVQIESPLTPDRAEIIGPITYTVSPTGKVVSVSHDIDYGYVQAGSFLERVFQVSNVGTLAVIGTAALEKGIQFKLMESGAPVSQVSIGLAPGESADVTVRFGPSVVSSLLTDTFQVRTDGGNVDRTVTGNSAEPAVIPDPDINADGKVDDLDLFLFLRNWHLQRPSMPHPQVDLDSDDDADERDLLRFLDLWHRP